jgi:hypothetical protein
MLTAIIPEAPQSVATQVLVNDIVITWSHPSADFATDYGAELLAYSV